MVFIFPAIFVILGLGLGGGLLYASHRIRNQLQRIENARPCKAGNPVLGLVKMHGTVKAVNPDELLISPIEQRPCVYYRLVIEQFRQADRSGHKLTRPAPGSGSWERIVEDVQAIPMVLADETGEVVLDPKDAQLDFKSDSRHTNFLGGLSKEVEQSIRERYKIVTKTFFIPKQMRYTEVVIAQDAEVFVVGDCEVKDGKASLAKKDNPMLMTFRKEEDVVRKSKIATTVYKVLGVGVPLLFLVLAWFAYSSIKKDFFSQPNAVKAGGKDGSTHQAIDKHKNNKSRPRR